MYDKNSFLSIRESFSHASGIINIIAKEREIPFFVSMSKASSKDAESDIPSAISGPHNEMF